MNNILLYFFVFFTFFLRGQTSQVSFFSAFGTGISDVQNTIENDFLSGAGVSHSSSDELNFSNPAMLSSVSKTIYTAGGRYTYLNTHDKNHSQKARDFSLSYFALGFPLGKQGGLALGIRSHTKVAYAYALGDEKEEQGLTTAQGDGGEDIVFLSAGRVLFDKFSLGIEAGYIFGNLNHLVIYKEQTLQYHTWFKNKTDIRGLQAKLGLHYFHTIFKDGYINYAMTFTYNKPLNLRQEEFLYKGKFNNAESYGIRQTLYENESTRRLAKPLKTTLGIAIQEPLVWYAGLNMSFQKAFSFSKAAKVDRDDFSFQDAYKIALGGYYVPDFRSLTDYYKKITYRAGLFYQKTGINFANESVSNMGFSFGLSLPIGLRQLSALNMGMIYNVMGNSSLQEQQFVFKVGLTFRDFWFFKRKID